MKKKPRKGENNPGIKNQRKCFSHRSLEEILKRKIDEHFFVNHVLCGYLRQNGKNGFYLRIREDDEDHEKKSLIIKIGGYCAKYQERCSYKISCEIGKPSRMYWEEELCPKIKKDYEK